MNTNFLSPQSKAIVDAYSEANDCYYEELGQIAAAIREAVNQVFKEVTISYDALQEFETICKELEELK